MGVSVRIIPDWQLNHLMYRPGKAHNSLARALFAQDLPGRVAPAHQRDSRRDEPGGAPGRNDVSFRVDMKMDLARTALVVLLGHGR